MSNELQEVGYEMPSGNVVYVPSAESVSYTLCGEHSCGAVHVFLLDAMGQPFAEATITASMCRYMLKILEEAT